MLNRAQNLKSSLIGPNDWGPKTLGSLSLRNLISMLGLAGEEQPVHQRVPEPGEIWYRTAEVELMRYNPFIRDDEISKVKIYEVKPNTNGTTWVQYGFESTLEKDGFLDSPFRHEATVEYFVRQFTEGTQLSTQAIKYGPYGGFDTDRSSSPPSCPRADTLS